jgi:DNA primase
MPVSGEDWAAWLRRVAQPSGQASDPLSGAAPNPTGSRSLPGAEAAAPGGEAAATVWDAMTWLARREGFAVHDKSSATHDSRTIWAARSIQLSADLDDESSARRLLHELGHILAHATMADVPGATTAGCTGIRKVEADSIAFIVTARLGTDTSSYRWPYVASWAGSDPRAHPEATIQAARERIERAAAAITGYLDLVRFGRPPQDTQQVPARGQAGPEQSERHAEVALSSQPTDRPPQRGEPEAPAHPAHATATDPQPPVLRRVLLDAERFYLTSLPRSWAPAYLAARGLSPQTITQWRIGYAPRGWTTLLAHLRRLGYTDPQIEAAGLARRSSRGTLIDHFRDRVMLAIHDVHGMITGFTGRAHPKAAKTVPKYLNSPQTSLYRKGELLFGLPQARSHLAAGAMPVIVEGPFDAIAVTTAGHRHYAGLAPCGTALTGHQLAALATITDLTHTGVLMALDADSAGRRALLKAYELLLPHTARSLAAILPSGQDPAQILQAGGPAALRAALGRNEPLAAIAIDAHLDQWASHLGHIEGRQTAMRSAAHYIAHTLPAATAEAIHQITGGSLLETLDKNLHHIPNPELPAIARLLPPTAACQIIRIADRTGYPSDDVTAEVANAVGVDHNSPAQAVSPSRTDERNPAPTREPPSPRSLVMDNFPASASPTPRPITRSRAVNPDAITITRRTPRPRRLPTAPPTPTPMLDAGDQMTSAIRPCR